MKRHNDDLNNPPLAKRDADPPQRYVQCEACGGSGHHQDCGTRGCAACDYRGYCQVCGGAGGWYEGAER